MVIGLTALTIHFFLVWCSVNPFIKEKTKLNYWADYYVNPFFQQTWTLFTPPPDTNFQLIASYEANGHHTEDVFTDILSKHQANRLKGYEPLLLAFATSIHYFEKTALLNNQQGGRVKNDINFNIVEHATRNYLRYKNKTEIEKLKLILVVRDINQPKARIYYN